jgi:hypothetical protein
MKKRWSILDNLDFCYFCAKNQNVFKKSECIHEVFYGRNRQTSINNGFCVGLCNYHHNFSKTESVHNNHEMDLELKQLYQRKYEEDHTRAEFIQLIDKSYL